MLRDAIGRSGTTQFRGYGDLSLTEVLPALLTRYCETDLMIVAPSLPDQAADIIAVWMRRQMARMDGRGRLYYVRRLTVIADLAVERSPKAAAWVRDNPFGDRLVLIDRVQDDTAVLLPDIAVTGALNMRYGGEFVCTVTTVGERVLALWKQYSRLLRPARRAPNRAKAADAEARKPKAAVAGRHKEKAADIPGMETPAAASAPEDIAPEA